MGIAISSYILFLLILLPHAKSWKYEDKYELIFSRKRITMCWVDEMRCLKQKFKKVKEFWFVFVPHKLINKLLYKHTLKQCINYKEHYESPKQEYLCDLALNDLLVNLSIACSKSSFLFFTGKDLSIQIFVCYVFCSL